MKLAFPRAASTLNGAAVAALLAASLTAFSWPHVETRFDSLRRDLDRILGSSGWNRAEWGVFAVSLETGDTLFERDAEIPLAPASNVKLFTSAAALHYLGAEFSYETFVLATGETLEGVLAGDLILYGTGDPGLSERFHASRTEALERMADQIAARGITVIEGDVIGDGTFFRGPLLGQGWDTADLNDWFAAPVGALSFNENVVTLRVTPSSFGHFPPVLQTIPDDPGLPILNEATTGPGRLFVEREHPSQPIRLIGSLPIGGAEVWRRLTVRDPARFAAQAFRDVLEARGIRVRGRVRSVGMMGRSEVSRVRVWQPDPDVRIVARHRSPPLSDYLEVVNKESHNLIAESVLKTMGRLIDGDGSFRGGTRVVRRYLEEVVDIPAEEIVLLDGSGLSAENRTSASAFVALMRYMAGTPLWEPYLATLPEAGNRRELARMYRTLAAGNLRAKTGTIRGVSALSGVVRSAGGERIAFSILANRVPSTWGAKRIEDQIGAALAAFVRSPEDTPASSPSDPAPPPTTRATPRDAPRP